MPKHPNHRPQGTLDLLILKALTYVEPCTATPSPGGSASQPTTRCASKKVRSIRHSSECCTDKWLRANWGTTDTGRKARFYTVTETLLTEAVSKALPFA